MLALQAHDELGTQDVELAVQDAPLARDVALLGLELGDERAQVVVGERDEVDDIVHGDLLRVRESGVQIVPERPQRSSSG